jgi:DNA-binding MarR family transcriptional regulator
MSATSPAITPQLRFFLALAKARAVTGRRFDQRLGFQGVGLSDFLILLALAAAPEGKLRRADLAAAVGLTASGVTRMLLPMEKIGLVKRLESAHDARVSEVALAPSGKRVLGEAMERAEILADDLLPDAGRRGLAACVALLEELGGIAVH